MSKYRTAMGRTVDMGAMATYLEGYTQSLAIWARQLNLRGEGLCFDCDNAGLIQQGFVRP